MGRFLVRSNLFIAFCMMAYTAKTCLLLNGTNGSIHVNLLVFFAILFIYCYRPVNKRKYLVLLITALAGGISQLFYMPLRCWFALVPAGLLGVGYTFPVIPGQKGWKRLKDISWLKIIWIALAFSWLSTFLPVVYSGQWSVVSGQLATAVLFIFARSFLFVSALCIPFDIRDIKNDKQKGMRTLPIILGKNKSILIAISLLLIFILLVYIDHLYFALGLPPSYALIVSALISIASLPLAEKASQKFFFSFIYDGALLMQWILLMLFRN